VSRPTRARGLKLEDTVRTHSQVQSRPTRARGLKLDQLNALLDALNGRAPRGRVD